MAVTPAVAPPGCARMPPPARYMRSTVRVRAKVSGAWPPHWPDETTGITAGTGPQGSRQASIERTTDSSVSQNLFWRPLTWI